MEVIIKDCTVKKLKKELKKLPNNTIVRVMSYYSDKRGHEVSWIESVKIQRMSGNMVHIEGVTDKFLIEDILKPEPRISTGNII